MSDLETLEKVDSPTVQSAPPTRVWRWEWLVAPVMGISIMLHLALLFVPIPSFNTDVEEAIVEEDDPDAPDDAAIDILSLSDIAAPEPPPESPPESPPEQPAQPQSQPPPPSNSAPLPDPAQAERLPTEAPTDLAADVNTDPPIDNGTSDPGPPAFDPGPARDVFVGNISALPVTDQTPNVGLPPANVLREPGNAVCFLDPGGGEIAGAREARWLEFEPGDVYQILQESYAQTGVTFSELNEFCGERYFEAFTAEGQPFMKFSLVQLKGSTLLVIWDNPPQ